MLGLKQQVWVTSVVSDEDVEKALVLCYSLRRTFTSRRIAVIASSKISIKLKEALTHGFDFVFHLEEEHNSTGLRLKDFAKVYSFLVLRSFDQCVYVSPSMLALKNCDEIFSEKCHRITLEEKDMDATVFLFKPSFDNFKSLINGLENFNKIGTGLGTYFQHWNNIDQSADAPKLDKKFNIRMTRRKHLLGYEHEIFMVNLINYPNDYDNDGWGNTSPPGTLGRLVGLYWLKIHESEVKPLIQRLPGILASSIHLTNEAWTEPCYQKEPIAIVGMSCRFPSCNNLEEFWDLLFHGRDGTSNPPPFRWMREQCSKHFSDARKINAGFLKDPVDEFDAKFFGISPKEAIFMDPQHRLLHEVVWEGLEDACIDPHTLRGTSGSVFLGSWANDYKEIVTHNGNAEFYRLYMGNSIGAATARVSCLLGMTGPSIATESGCSSAMVAVHLACRSLQLGETNLALAGGVNLLLDPFNYELLPMALSQDGHCKTFSGDANGFARADGCGVLVLKRLSDALKNGDNIWGLVRGSAVAQEGLSKSLGTPTIHCESLAMNEALQDAGVRPEEVSYVEAHGTGTVVGDPVEVAAIAMAYGSRLRQEPLIIGSVKTNVGHTESCSGITGIIKVILGMQHEVIPAHQNFTTLNPNINLEAVPAVIPMEFMEWKKSLGKPRIAGVSSFGITGTDAHVIIQEPPEHTITNMLSVELERPLHILTISAKTEEALDMLISKYKNSLEASNESLADITYSANVGRASFHHRAAIIGKTKDDMISSIHQHKCLKGECNTDAFGKVCFLFTGQGSQYPGMAKKLYESSLVFQIHFDYCESIMTKYLDGISIKNVLWSAENMDVHDLNRTIFSQTSIFCVEYALLKLWDSWGVKPDVVLGHSLGEFAAAVCAGILAVEDAIKLVAERSRLIDELQHGKMLVLHAGSVAVEKEIKYFAGNDPTKLLDIAAINSCQQTVVAGDADVVIEFFQYCTNNGIKCMILPATHAFHSKHMDPMLDSYKSIAQTTTTKMDAQKCVYVSGMTGDVMDAKRIDADYWADHARESVNFIGASKKAVELGCRVFIEVGPQPVLSALTMMNNENANLLCLPSLKRKENEWETMLTSLGKMYLKGFSIDWEGFDQFQRREKVRLPYYPFIRKKYWPDMMQVCGNMMHPLVGSAVPNATSAKIFQNGINLQAHEYLNDHAIGQTVLFPGAGYLEMSLAAGLATIEGLVDSLDKTSRPMKVENLMIKAPLGLNESKASQLQTVTQLNTSVDNQNDWNDVKVEIYQRLETDSTPKFLLHSTATYSPFPTTNEKTVSIDKEDFFCTLMQPPDKETISHAYERLALVGLKFGPTFRSLVQVWRNQERNTMLAKLKLPNEEKGQASQYILHPVVLDAMIQAIMMLHLPNKTKTKLCVPIKIGKFLWLSNGEAGGDRYVHVFQELSNSTNEGTMLSTTSNTALLLDSTGKVLASMSEVELIETTVKTIDAVLEHQSSTMPELWQETWRPTLGPSQDRFDLREIGKESFCDKTFRGDMHEKFNTLTPEMGGVLKNLETLLYYNFLCCLYECGWTPILNHVFTQEELRAQLKIKKEYSKMFGFMLGVLEEEGILKNVGSSSWQVVATPPSPTIVQDRSTASTFTSELVTHFKSTLLLQKLGEIYSDILKGTKSALPILFPEEGDKSAWPSAANFYDDYAIFIKMKDMGTIVSLEHMKYWKSKDSGGRNTLRVLEIGAGTGSFTFAFLNNMKSLGMKLEHTFTDISPAFFTGAEKLLHPHLKHIKFKKLNIEEDPISQGFTPHFYDWIIAGDVIHATKCLSETLGNVGMLLKPGGAFDIIEQTKTSRVISYTFGLLDGFWRFEDLDLRPNHCTLSSEKWVHVLQSTGFQVMESFPCMNTYHSYISSRRLENPTLLLDNTLLLKGAQKSPTWIVFHHQDSPISKYLLKMIKTTTNRKVISVTRGENYASVKGHDDGEWRFELQPGCKDSYTKFIKSIESYGEISIEGVLYCWSLDKTCTTQDTILRPYFYAINTILGMKQNLLPRIVTLVSGLVPVEDNDLSHFHTSTIWGLTKALLNEQIEINCRCVDIGDEAEQRVDVEQVFYELWNTDKEAQVAYYDNRRYISKVELLKPASLVDLKLPSGSDRFQLLLPETKSIQDLQFGSFDSFSLEDGEIEIQVKASALNFRDVFTVLKPSDEFKKINAVGFDFAGIVKRIGAKVTKWSVGSQVFGVNFNGDALPSHIKLKENDVLPVPKTMTLCEACTLPAVVTTSYHCLIDVAKITSADTVLIHTASGGVGLSAIEICKSVGATIIATAGSKRKQNYLRSLGIEHVFHSRNTNYGDDILRVTNGRGVDVVLNSLTSEGFKEATLRACAKGARFVEMSKLNIWQPEQVMNLRQDVKYSIVDLSSMESSEWHRLIDILNQLVDKKVVCPIPYVRFDGVHIREALQYLQAARHIGKVVCCMPEIRIENGKPEVHTPIFSVNATYLITGGLGGIGFVVCKWMVEKGAKHVLLVGRNVPTNSMQKSIDRINLDYFANVQAVQLDVGNFAECRDLFHVKLPQMGLPKIRGVMHAAGTLNDGLIENHTWETLSSTFNAKINGTLNLHELTKDLKLEHFVFFSSIASLFGSPGQSNHSAGNNFEDIFAHYRHSIGLPATSVNWGPWGEVGVATEVDIPGLKPLSNVQGLTALEFVLKSQRIQTGAIKFSSLVLFRKFIPRISHLVDERVWKSIGNESGNDVTGIKSDEFWERYDSLQNTLSKTDLLQENLLLILRSILKLEQTDIIEANASFQEMGVDSLMFVEIKNAVQTLLGSRVTVNASAIRDCSTVAHLTSTLIKIIEGDDLEVKNVPTMEQVAELIKDDCHLPESIMSGPNQERVAVNDIHNILLTGCSGTLGPHILKELTSNPQVTQVVCLLQPKRNISEEGRLRRILEERELLAQVDMTKVRCVSGNVALPNLGMEPIVWKELCDSLDAIFHCAASVLHMEHYRKDQSGRDSRAVNIGGMKNVLELACTGSKLKQVYSASSMLAVSSIDEDGKFSESWPEPNDYDGVTTRAYPITKFVGDMLMKQAVLERGIPGKVFRFPFIVGDSKTGRFVVEHNHLMLRYLFILKHKIMSTTDYFPIIMLPVDICAWATVQIFFNPTAPNDIYNVCNTAPFVGHEFISVAKKLGFDIDFVEYSEFCQTVQESRTEDSPLALFKDFYGNEEDLMSFFSTSPVLRQWILEEESHKDFMVVSKKIGSLLPEFFSDLGSNADHLYRDLLFAKSQGWFEKYCFS